MNVKKTGLFVFNVLLLILQVKGSVVRGEGQGVKSVLCFFEGVPDFQHEEEEPFVPENLDLEICTHVVYQRAVVSDGLEIVPKNRTVALLEDGGRGLYSRTVQLKAVKPELKVYIDVLADVEEVRKLVILGNQTDIARFAKTTADFVQTQGFDGMNLRFSLPGGIQALAQALHEEFSRRGLALTTILFSPQFPDEEAIDMTESLSRNFDLIVVGSHWKLPFPTTRIFSSLTELENVLEAFKTLGIPSQKLVVAIPAFFFTVKLCSPEDRGVGHPICGFGDEGEDEKKSTLIHISELERKMKNSSEEWIVVRNDSSRVPYAYSDSLEWLSFEDTASVTEKANFVLKEHLGGVAIMSLNMEDFKGEWSAGGVKFPLTRAAFNALQRESQQ